MGLVYSNGRDVSCDFCGTGQGDLKELKRDPSKGKGSSQGEITRAKICESCLDTAKNKDPEGWERRIESGRYEIKEL